MKEIETIREADAIKRGFRALTVTYTAHERPMLESALKTLRGCNVVLVHSVGGVEIWRAAAEIKKLHD